MMEKMIWKYVKQLKDSGAIDDFESKNEIALPPDLKNVIKTNNGGRPSLRFYDLPGEKDKEIKTLLSYNVEDAENVYKRYPVDQNVRSMIPFAVDPSGNLLVIHNGNVFFWNHETSKLAFVANTFTCFLEMLHE